MVERIHYTAGRLAAVQYRGVNTGSGCSATFQDWYNYGVPGAVVGKRMHIAGLGGNYDLTATFAYDSEGRLTSETNPTDYNGVTGSYATTYDSMGRPSTLTDQVASRALIGGASYGPANELTSLQNGGTYNGAFGSETRTYNSMKQLTQIQSTPYSFVGGVSTTYNYAATQNNGKITSQYDSLDGETISYGYDSLGRLSAASSGIWSQGYTYDGFGNLTSVSGTNANSFTTDPATNHAPCSDANGNADEVHCAGSYNGYTYDVENRVSVTPSSSPGGTTYYSYGPGNRRVWRGGSGSNGDVTFYGPNGQKLGVYELEGSGEFSEVESAMYFGGRLIGYQTSNALNWVYPDRLGSQGHYYPFGGDRPVGSQNPTSGPDFTGYERDAETGNDYAVNRYMQPGSGRFMSADSVGTHSANPDSFNKYSYTGGDPVNRIDPSGRDFCGIDILNNPDDGVPIGDYPCGGTVYGPAGPVETGQCPTNPAPSELLSTESNPGGDPGAGGGEEGPCYGSPAEAPAPPPPACSISLYERPAGGHHRPWKHTYLVLDDPLFALTPPYSERLVLQAGPSNMRPWGGYLTPEVIVPGQGGFGSDKNNSSGPGQSENTEIGSPFTGPQACTDILELIGSVGNYVSHRPVAYLAVPVPFTGTYNSNSFTSTLLNDIGLSFGNPGFAPGWGPLFRVPNLNLVF